MAIYFDTVTATNAATALTGTVTFATLQAASVRGATIRVAVAEVRYRADGTDPTAAVGTIAGIGDVINLTSLEEIRDFKAIRTGGTSGVLSVHFTSRP